MKRIATTLAAVLLLTVIGWQQYQIHQIELETAKAQRTADFAVGLDKITNALVNAQYQELHAELRAR
jgi:hypothetical protein